MWIGDGISVILPCVGVMWYLCACCAVLCCGESARDMPPNDIVYRICR